MTGVPDNLPDPVEAPGSQDPMGAPNLARGLPVDPLDRALDQLEASVERQYRLGDRAFQDPIADMLDRLEISIEGRQPDGQPKEEWLPDLLRLFSMKGAVIGDGDGGTPVAETPIVLGSESSPGESRDAALPQLRLPSGAGRPEGRGRGGRRQGSNPLPARRVIGRNTGLRHTGSDPNQYCRLREAWVSVDECASCTQFERAEEGQDDQCDMRCRHGREENEDYHSQPEQDGGGEHDD